MNQQDLEVLDREITRLEDIQAIKDLQMKYGYYFETQRLHDIVDLFSENTESIEITDHGLFYGKKGVRTQFLEWMGRGANRDAQPQSQGNPAMSGGLVCIMQLQGVIELAEDGRTAAGRWVCFDMEARPWCGVMRNYWLHGYYENKYIKENGQWLFLKLHWNNTFWTPYTDGWLKTPLLGNMDEHPTIRPDLPATAFHPYPSGWHLPYSFKHPV
ncbi:MAG TPA: nuclear transport factor 2 family protein [Dehalococcoidales bacterium]|nr:nuclear transport factor 2 family protein [Dehalococcoidales bacterium]